MVTASMMKIPIMIIMVVTIMTIMTTMIIIYKRAIFLVTVPHSL